MLRTFFLLSHPATPAMSKNKAPANNHGLCMIQHLRSDLKVTYRPLPYKIIVVMAELPICLAKKPLSSLGNLVIYALVRKSLQCEYW